MTSTFEAALTEHLAALQARDIARFAATLGDDVTVVDGTGAIVSGRDIVLHSHAEWFASADAWRFEYELHFARNFGSAGLALIEVSYVPNPQSEPARFLLSLVFERNTEERWAFVYDQNTPLGAAV